MSATILRWGRALCAAAVLLSFTSLSPGLAIETVPVGNPGCWGVSYEYNIGKYEVTAGQYTEFLNAVAGIDTYSLYGENMWSHAEGCKIERYEGSGMVGDPYRYRVADDWRNRPVNDVSWGDAARFVNWLHNGQPIGGQDLTTTEDGAYYLNGAMTNEAAAAAPREADWWWAIPTDSEWRKAAYHKNDGVTDNYFQYPTSNDGPPGYVIAGGVHDPRIRLSRTGAPFVEGGADPGNFATYDCDGGIPGIGPPYYRTVVGEWEHSASPYGTFDQGGNVIEWNETVDHEGTRGRRGGAYTSSDGDMLSWAQMGQSNPSIASYAIGFRVVEAPVPAGLIPGDANYDGAVTDADYTAWADNYGATDATWKMGDFNLSGEVTEADYTIWADNYGNTAGAIPEPVAVALLSLGALALLRRRKARVRLCLILFLATPSLAAGQIAWTDTFGAGANQFMIDFVTIRGDTSPASGYGMVDYDYRIGTYEVTNEQWSKFRAALGLEVEGNPSTAYDEVSPFTGANMPLCRISWYEAAQFVNWLNTSTGHHAAYKFTGIQGTDNYAFAIWAADEAADGTNLYRHRDAFYFLPTENEWYKAAYWDGDAIRAYATKPGEAVHQGDGIGGTGWNYYDDGYATEAEGPWDVGSGSRELNDTYDMMGNVWEWMGSPYAAGAYEVECKRGMRGGHYKFGIERLSSAYRDYGTDPSNEFLSTGFRVASQLRWLPLGDANGDGAVTDADYTIWADHYGAINATWSMGDFNLGGEVTEADYTIWADNYREAVPGNVPEPATVTLLILAATALARRRRDAGNLGIAPLTVAVLIGAAQSASADVFSMGPGLFSLETVRVGNPGSTADMRYNLDERPEGFGGVDYEYDIGKYEITASQYCEFLNAVAATDTYGLYNPAMDIDSGAYLCQYGCNIKRTVLGGSYTYSVAVEWANRPANWVGWGDAARFANWLHNGQPTGAQDLTTTEDGAYCLNGAVSDAELFAVSREADWKWAIPTEDEWHKAAYHKNDGDTGNYFDYPTSSNAEPGYVDNGAELSNESPPTSFIEGGTDPGNYATFDGDDLVGGNGIGSPYYRTEVGEWENSSSPYGTFDMAANVWEWNEAILNFGQHRGMSGGSFGQGPKMSASFRGGNAPQTGEHFYTGLRVCAAVLPIPGDANEDGVVSDADYTIWADHYRDWPATWDMGDFDGSGEVTDGDYTIWADNYGSTVGMVPEPGVLALIGFGVLAALRSRKAMAKPCLIIQEEWNDENAEIQT